MDKPDGDKRNKEECVYREADPDWLISELQRGDRQAGAEFLRRFSPMIRRRIRGKLGTQMRRVFDSEDIFSTVSRRLDKYIGSGRLNAGSEPQMWSLIFKMADAAIIDKLRISARLNQMTQHDNMIEQCENELDSGNDPPPRVNLAGAFAFLTSDQDRQILSLWLSGARHDVIAGAVGLTHATTRKRWQAIRGRLRKWADQEVT